MGDAGLLASPCDRPGAVFVAELPDRQSYHGMIAETLRLHAAGAVCLIARTNTPAVATKLRNAGGIIVSHEVFEGVEKDRWIVPPEKLTAWCAKVRRVLK